MHLLRVVHVTTGGNKTGTIIRAEGKLMQTLKIIQVKTEIIHAEEA